MVSIIVTALCHWVDHGGVPDVVDISKFYGPSNGALSTSIGPFHVASYYLVEAIFQSAINDCGTLQDWTQEQCDQIV